MNPNDNGRNAGCIYGMIGLVLGLVIGFLFDAIWESTTGEVVRRGFSTDTRAALLKAFIGGVIGLVGGQLVGRYLARKRDD